MKTLTIRPADPQQDFEQIAEWFSVLEDEPSSKSSLIDYYEKNADRILQKVAEDETGQLVGFCWIVHLPLKPETAFIHLYVKPEERGKGIGRQLYKDLIKATENSQLRQLLVLVSDAYPECKTFAQQRGFIEKRHEFKMVLDLATFEEQPYDELLTKLRGEGFRFTSMEELGDTEEARHKLYTLNTTTDMETLGSSGRPAWDTFDEFQNSVCQSEWYKPSGQIVAIDTTTGAWVAMCAITRLDWHHQHANILYTGVDAQYRGRKLAQAVKVIALRYAKDILKANVVYTDNNAQNLPMIAINRKLGYTMLPGTFTMEKIFE